METSRMMAKLGDRLSSLRQLESSQRRAILTIQAGKAALAGLLAWLVAAWWWNSDMAIMAPWVAIVVVQTTVYRSLSVGVRQLGAIAAGTVLASVVLMIVHNQLLAMSVVLPATLVASSWPKFGDQGVYSATTALFVLVYGTGTPVAALERLRDAVAGATVAFVVNLIMLPPTYLRRSETAARAVAVEAASLLRDAAETTRGEGDGDRARSWVQRSTDLQYLLDSARTMAEWRRESLLFNPRRLMPRQRHRNGPAVWPREALEVLGPIVTHTMGIIRGVSEIVYQASDDEEAIPDHFRDGLTGYLQHLGDACDAYAEHLSPEGDHGTTDPDSAGDDAQPRSLDGCLQDAEQAQAEQEEARHGTDIGSNLAFAGLSRTVGGSSPCCAAQQGRRERDRSARIGSTLALPACSGAPYCVMVRAIHTVKTTPSGR